MTRLTLFMLLTLWPMLVTAGQVDISHPAHSFTDPALVFPMDESWQGKSIVYAPSVGEADIVLSLDQHLYPAFLPLIQKYALQKKLRIVVNEGTCGISIGNIAAKKVDMAGFCCPPGKMDRLPGLQFHTVGIAALALFVHPDNPVDNVTLAQARDIFGGTIHRWSEISSATGQQGRDIPIQAIARLHCKKRPGHWKLLLANEDLFGPGVQEVGTIRDMITLIARNPRAIGYEVLWNEQRYAGKVKALKINGFSPLQPKNVISLDFPLYRTYSITTWQSTNCRNPKARDLVDFLVAQTTHLDPQFAIIPVGLLRKAGWKFRKDELIGTP